MSKQPDNILHPFPQTPPEPPQPDNSRGVGLGLLLCGLALLIFAHFTAMPGWAMWAFNIVGLVLLLIGILGWCIERAKR